MIYKHTVIGFDFSQKDLKYVLVNVCLFPIHRPHIQSDRYTCMHSPTVHNNRQLRSYRTGRLDNRLSFIANCIAFHYDFIAASDIQSRRYILILTYKCKCAIISRACLSVYRLWLQFITVWYMQQTNCIN